jgi:tetratricopeptide (TPR) repeat protein
MTRRQRGVRTLLTAAGVLWLAAAAAPQTSSAYFEFLMARRLEAAGDQAGALAALERAAAADPASAEVRAEIAAFQLRRDRRAEAEAAAREALKLNEANLEAHRVLGLVYTAQADNINANAAPQKFLALAREAIQHLERAAKEQTTAIDVLFSLGRLYLRTGEAKPAVDTFIRVVTQNPGSAQGRLFLAQAYAAADDLKNAIATLDVIVEEEPRVASTLAQYQEEAGLLKEAVENYTRALAVEPTNRGLKVRRITALIAARDFARAATLAAEGQAQHGDDPRFPRLRARALDEGGDVARALAVLEPTARAFPKDAATQFQLADLYNDAGRDADAERTLRQLLQIEPGNAQVLNYLGYLLAERGQQLDEAVRLIERALDLDAGNPYYLDSLGWAHFRRGDLDAAEKYLAPAAQKLPRNAEVQDHLGDLLARRGRWAEAVQAWTRALDGDAGDADRTALQKKIADAKTRLKP